MMLRMHLTVTLLLIIAVNNSYVPVGTTFITMSVQKY